MKKKVLSWLLILTLIIASTPITGTAYAEDEVPVPDATEYTETATPEPATATPEPATATPEPATATPEPATATPEPATATPEPATATPEPATATPEPATATPEPATATPEPSATPEPTYSLAASVKQLDFGTAIAGYTAVETQRLTLTNTGSGELTLSQPEAKSFVFGRLQTTTLAAGSSVTLTVAPAAGLEAGRYSEQVTLTADHNATVTVKLLYEVTAAPVLKTVTNTLPIPENFTGRNWSACRVLLDWDDVTGASSYIVERSTGNASNFSQLATTVKSFYLDNNSLVYGTKYYYRIRALASGGTSSSFTDSIGVTVVPLTPTLVSVEPASSTSLKITWEKSTDATGYYLYQSVSGSGAYTKIATFTSLSTVSYTNTGLTTGVDYSYFIQVYNSASGSPVVSQNSNIITAAPEPLPPEKVNAASSSYNSVTISWSTVSDATSYSIRRSDVENGTFQQIGTTTSTSYADTSLQTGVTYYYKIVSITDSTSSALSVVASATPIAVAPTGLTATSISDNTARLNWTSSLTSGYSGYIIEQARYSPTTFTEVKRIVGPDVSTTLVDGLITGESYYFRIRGYTNVSSGIIRGVASMQVACTPKPNTPASFKALPCTSTTLKLSWSCSTVVTGFEIYRSTSSTLSTFVKVAHITPANASTYTYINRGLTKGQTYYYRIIAFITNSVGTNVYSDYSGVISGVPVPVRPASFVLKSSTYNAATFRWTASYGADGYELYSSTTASGTYSLRLTVSGGSSTSGTITGLTTEQKLYIKARSYIIVNNVKYYSAYTAYKTVTPELATPTLSTVSATLSSIKLIWNWIDGASGFEIYASDTEDGTYTRLTTVGTVTNTTVSVITGMKKYFKVRAYNLVSGTKKYGEYSNKSGVTAIPKAPAISSITSVGESALKIRWKQTTDIAGRESGYILYRGTVNSRSSLVKIATLSRSDLITYQDTDVTIGQTYYYSVRAYAVTDYGIRYSRYSTIKSGYTLPSSATNLSISLNTTSSLTLKWKNNASQLSGFDIYYAATETGTYRKLGTTTSTGSQITYNTPSVLEYAITYYFKVRPYLRLSNSTIVYGNFTSIVSGRTLLERPASINAVSTGSGQIKVWWGRVSAAQGYLIYVSQQQDTGYTLAATARSGAIAKTVYNLTPGKTYYFKVCGYYKVGTDVRDGTWSLPASATNITTPPTNVKATTLSYNSIKLTWNAVSGAAGYTIYRSLAGKGSYSILADGVTALEYTVSNLTTGVSYDYYIRSYLYNSSHTVLRSAASSVVTGRACVLAPSSVAVRFVSSWRMRVSWRYVSHASGYTIERATSSSGPWTTVVTLQSADVLSYYDNVGSIAYGQKLYYRVTAYSLASGTLTRRAGIPSKVVSATRLYPTPTGLTASSESSGSITLNWTLRSDVTGYWVYRSESAGGTYRRIASNLKKVSSFTDTGLTQGKTYYYKIRGYSFKDGVMSLSAYSSAASARP